MSEFKQETLDTVTNMKVKKPTPKHLTISPLFWVCVIYPVLIAFIYFGFIASDVYISESKFIIRSHNSHNTASGFGALLQTTGMVRSQDDSYTVNTYINSRDAMFALNHSLNLINIYTNSNINRFSRFNPLGIDGSYESFHEYLKQKIIVDIDAVSMISSLTVRAYSPEDAYRINESLLSISETLVNQLNDRARADTIGFANKQVEEAQVYVRKAADNLYQFRLKNGIYNLDRQTETHMLLISKLQDELISVQTHLSQVKTVTENNPQIVALKAREQNLQKEIESQFAKIFGSHDKAITINAAEYESLMLEHKLAEQQLVTAMTSLEKAKEEAQRKSLYLERIAQPHKPDAALEPKRLLNILATLIIGLLLYGIISLFISSVKEHRD